MTLYLQALLQGLLQGGVYALVAAGLALTFGVTKVLNFAHGAFFMVALYLSVLLSQLVHPYLAIIVVVPTMMAVGVLLFVGLVRPVMNTRFLIQAQMTLGVVLVLEGAASLVFGLDPQGVTDLAISDAVLRLGDVVVPWAQFIAGLIGVVTCCLLFVLLNRTDFGRSMRAIAQDREAATLCGVPVERTHAATWAIGLGLVGLAAPLVIVSTFVTPHTGNAYIVLLLLAVVLGGMGDLLGAVLGSILIGVMAALGQATMGGSLALVPAYALVVLILVFRPSGLLGRGAEL